MKQIFYLFTVFLKQVHNCATSFAGHTHALDCARLVLHKCKPMYQRKISFAAVQVNPCIAFLNNRNNKNIEFWP